MVGGQENSKNLNKIIMLSIDTFWNHWKKNKKIKTKIHHSTYYLRLNVNLKRLINKTFLKVKK